jgi:peptide/nickel transport system substrate-binding protein
MTSAAKWNETHWQHEQWNKLYNEAIGTLDEAKRNELIGECQKIEWEEGGYIIHSFANFVDAYSAKLGGIEPDVAQPLGHYRFRLVHIL